MFSQRPSIDLSLKHSTFKSLALALPNMLSFIALAVILADAVLTTAAAEDIGLQAGEADAVIASQAQKQRHTRVDTRSKSKAYQCSAPAGSFGHQAERTTTQPLALIEQQHPIEISAGSLLLQADSAIYKGKVDVKRGDVYLHADRASLDVATKDIQLLGNVLVALPGAELEGSSASINMETNASMISDAEYFIEASPSITGFAGSVAFDEEQRVTVLDGSYTRCDPERKEWEVEAKELLLDPGEGQGVAKGAIVKVFDKPIVYIPYMRFPVGGQRQSGFLFPALATASDGIDLAVPYYFNLAPNYDLLFAPRYRAGHGYLTELHGRWLNPFDRWEAKTMFIDSDRERQNDSRWSINLAGKSHWQGNLRSEVNITRVSDSDVPRDLQSNNFAVTRSSSLAMRGQLEWINQFGSIGTAIERFQSIDPNLDIPNEKQPEVWLDLFIPSKGWRPSLSSDLRYTLFDTASVSANGQIDSVQRTAGELALALPFRIGSASLDLGAASEFRYYDLERANAALLDGDANAWINIAKLNATLAKRYWRKSDNGQSTRRELLQPELSYSYRHTESGARSLDSLPQLDSYQLSTTLFDLDTDTLLGGDSIESRDLARFALRYSAYRNGRNSQTDEDNLTVDTAGGRHSQKRHSHTSTTKLRVGGLNYFSRNEGNGTTPLKSERRWFAEGSWQPAGRWQTQASLVWSDLRSEVALSNIGFKYHRPQGEMGRQSIVNFGYHRRADSGRFASPEPIEQLDVSAVYPFKARWAFYGRFQYDQKNARHTEALAGIEYDDCCFRWRLVYRDGLIYQPTSASANRDRTFMLQLQLKGLGGVGSSVEDMLERSIRGFSASD